MPGGHAGATELLVGGLLNGVSYRAQVRAVNVAGDGLASAETEQFTPTAAVTWSEWEDTDDVRKIAGWVIIVQKSTSSTGEVKYRTRRYREADGDPHAKPDPGTQTANRLPTANAGSNQTVSAGASVTLSGSGSDPDNDPLTYAWTQTGGASVPLVDANTATASFTAAAPNYPATLTFKLTVSDGRGGTDTDSVTVTVATPTPTGTPSGPSNGNGNGGDDDNGDDDTTTSTDTGWEDTGRYTQQGPHWQKEQQRIENGVRITQWVSITVTEWTRTGKTDGALGDRRAEEERTFDDAQQTRWVPDPEPKVWGDWEYTGETQRLGPNDPGGPADQRRKKRTNNYGEVEYDWETYTPTTQQPAPPQKEEWRQWEDTGETTSQGGRYQKRQRSRSNLGNVRYQWISFTWGPWADTGQTRNGGRQKEQRRTHGSLSETRWVDVPEVWSRWADTGKTQTFGPNHPRGPSREKEQERTNNFGERQTRWVPVTTTAPTTAAPRATAAPTTSRPTTAAPTTQPLTTTVGPIWTPWRPTGTYRRSGSRRQQLWRRENRVSGLSQTEWRADPEPTTTRTTTRRPTSTRTTTAAPTTRPIPVTTATTTATTAPPTTWGPWTDTGRTRTLGPNHPAGPANQKEQERTHGDGRRQTRWVDA